MIQDLISFINDLRKPYHELILHFDVNKFFSSLECGISKLTQQSNMIDPFLPNMEVI